LVAEAHDGEVLSDQNGFVIWVFDNKFLSDDIGEGCYDGVCEKINGEEIEDQIKSTRE
jgi:hypothetical protein